MHPTKPGQAWAHKAGLIELRALDQVEDNGSLADRLAINEAFARYGIAFDETLVDILGSLFTEDAVVTVSEGGPPFQTVRGRDAIKENFSSVFRQQGDQRRHCVTNVVVDRLSGNEADALAYGIVAVAANGVSVGVSCIYRASLRKSTEGHWRFQSLWIGMDAYTGEKPETAST